MAKKTFQQIAIELGVPYCGGINKGFRCYLEHDLNGSLVDGTIHLTDRNGYRASTTAALLSMAARIRDPSLDADLPWRRVYRVSIAARGLAAEIHVRLPREVWDFNRAFVKAGVAGLSNDVPLRKQAYDWARR
jgi:hypothetical protein